LKLNQKISSASIVDFLGNEVKAVSVNGDRIMFEIGRYKILTVKIKLG